MADALNRRIHRHTIAADALTIAGARGQRIAAGDLILTRHNDASIPLRNTDNAAAEQSVVRNGQRWRVTRINADNNRLIAERLDDHTLAAFSGDYVREHITHGYAATVHSAQGVTADATHADLSETATRALSYVAMTRGRDANTAYLYERTAEHEYQQESAETGHVTVRGSSQHAARLFRAIVANDEHPMTAHGRATAADQALPYRVRSAMDQRAAAIRHRAMDFEEWRVAAATLSNATRAAHRRDVGTDRSIDDGLAL
jgi:hypothetical protein